MNPARWRKPRLQTCIIFFLPIALFCAAAHWQWQRAEFKQQRAAAFAAAIAEPAQRGLSSALASPGALGFDRVHVAGKLDAKRLILLDNQVRDGRFGVEVYAVLDADADMHVLAGLGWVPSDPSRQQLPRIPAFAERVDADGLLTDPPAAGLQLGAAGAGAAAQFPLLTTRIDPPELRTQLKLADLADRVVLLAPDAASGFVRDWHLGGLGADRHRGYALQWISFAIGTLVFFVLWHRPRKGSSP